MEREIAHSLPLKEIKGGEYCKEDSNKANYVITESGIKASRVKVFGVVSNEFGNEKMKGILIEDFTDSIACIAFENQDILIPIQAGATVELIGKVREGKEENLIMIEHLKEINFKEELLIRAENISSFKFLKKTENETDKNGDKYFNNQPENQKEQIPDSVSIKAEKHIVE